MSEEASAGATVATATASVVGGENAATTAAMDDSTAVAAAASPWKRAKEGAAQKTVEALSSELERLYYEARQECHAWQEKVTATDQLYRAALERTTALEKEHLSLQSQQHEWLLAKEQIQHWMREKELVQERMDRSLQEADQLREEISRLSASKADMSKQLADYEMQVKLKDSEVIPLFHEKQRLQTELDNVQQHCNWLEQELREQQNAYHKLQASSREQSIQLQQQLDQVSTEKESLEARLDRAISTERKLQTQLDQAKSDLCRAQQELEDERENSAQRIRDEQRIVALQKEHLSRWEQRYQDLQRETDVLKAAARRAMETSEQELQQERSQLEAKYKALLDEQAAAYEEKLSQLKQQQQTVQQYRPAGFATAVARQRAVRTNDDENRGGFDEDDNEPLSLTDLYAQLEETKSALRKEKARADRAEMYNQKIMKDVHDTTPMIKRQREEYEYAMEQLEEFQVRLDQALQEKEDALHDCREARAEIARVQRLLAERQAESHELAQQVQALLVSRAGGQVAPEEDIPTSVQEMQSQNQRLLSEHRRLTQKVTELQNQFDSDAVRKQLDAAEKEILTLREERDKQEAAVMKIARQRDLYRAILNQHDSKLVDGDGSDQAEQSAITLAQAQAERARKLEQKVQNIEGDLAVARSELDRVAREKDSMKERLARYELHSGELAESVNRLERELVASRGEAARAQSEANFHKERTERLEESLQRARDEVGFSSNAKNELQRINADLQRAMSSADADRMRLESEKRSMETKLRLVETQLHTSKAAETRMAEECNQLRSEIARQGAVVDSIRRIEASLSAKREGEHQKLSEEIEQLSRTLANERSKHTGEVENLHSRVRELEARVQDLDSAKDKAQSDALKAREEALGSKNEIHNLSSKCELLESQLRAAKKRLGESDESDDVEVSRQDKIDSLTADLEQARAEIESLREQSATYQKLAKDSEKALAEVTKITEDLRANHKTELDNLTAESEAYKKEALSKQDVIVELTRDLAGQRDERNKLETELRAENAKLMASLESNAKDLEAAKAVETATKYDIDNLRAEVAGAQQNYERELELHSQARTALRAAREEAQEERSRRLAAEEQLKSAKRELDEQKNGWAQERTTLNDTQTILEKSLKEAREQNTSLHNQLAIIDDLTKKSQLKRVADALASEGAETSGDAGEIESLKKLIVEQREVVNFLRSENQLIQTQLSTANRAVDRERAAASVLRRNLEEVRAELKVLQSQHLSEENLPQGLSEKLHASEDQMKLLRDSNKLLRDETEKLQATLLSTQAELDKQRKEAEPTKKEKRDLEEKVISLEAEKESLQRDLTAWKARVENLVSKFNQVDPAEYAKALKQVEALQKEKESLTAWKKTTEEENTRIREIARNLNQKLRDQKTQIDAQKKEIDTLTATNAALVKASSDAGSSVAKERDILTAKVAEMEKVQQSMKTELEGANTRTDKLREKLRQFQTALKSSKEKEKNLNEELAAAKLKIEQMTAEQAGSPAMRPVIPADAAPAKSVPTVVVTKATGEVQKIVPAGEAKESRLLSELPTVPEGGFQFGPSHAQHNQGSAALSSPSNLRVDAAPFIPIQGTALTARAEQPNAEETNQSADALSSKQGAPASNQSEASPSEPSGTPRPMSVESEISFKAKLLEKKKRKLAEAMERKRKAVATEATKASASESKTGEGDDQAQKKPKIEEPETDKEASVLPAITSEPTAVLSTETVGEKSDASEGKMDQLTAASTEKDSQAKVPVQKSQPDTPFGGAGSKSIFGSGSSAIPFGGPVTFGQSSSVAQPLGSSAFGATTASPAGAFGGTFLNIKPPGSSTAPPVFSFSSSGSITLPTPSQALPSPSAFGAFGSGVPFGSFGTSSSATPLASRPLFGAPPPQEEKEGNTKEGNDETGDAQV